MAARSRVKKAELLSALGAGVLGAGIALLLQRWLLPFAIPILLVGLAAHSWGMFEKHRAETANDVQRAPWENVLYWGCWASLGALVIYVASSVGISDA